MATKRFDINGYSPFKLWKPRAVASSELDNWPRCIRCSKRCGQSLPIEAYERYDEGDSWVVIRGRCRGRCESPDGPARLSETNLEGKDNFHDHVEIRWEKLTDAKVDEVFLRHMDKHIAAIRFFDDEEPLEA
jgi:hypothetical protein